MQADVTLQRQLAEILDRVHHTQCQARRRANEQNRIRCDRGPIRPHIELKLVVQWHAHDLEPEVVGRLPERGMRRYRHHHLGRANLWMMESGAISGGFHTHENAFRAARRDAAHGLLSMQQMSGHADDIAFEGRQARKERWEKRVGREELDERVLGDIQDIVSGGVLGAGHHALHGSDVVGLCQTQPPSHFVSGTAVFG